jgi:hypothetical protein
MIHNIVIDKRGDGWHWGIDGEYYGPYEAARDACLDIAATLDTLEEYHPEPTPPPLGIHVQDGIGAATKFGG